MTLPLMESTWRSARDHASAGRRQLAFQQLNLLLKSPETPDRLQMLAHRLAARLYVAQDQYTKARRHLYQAEKLDGSIAEIHAEIAAAFEEDPSGCDRRAARRYRKAVQLGAKTIVRAKLGRALIRINRVKQGVEELSQALEACPADLEVLKIVVEGMCEAGKPRRAQRIVQQARFLLRNDRRVMALQSHVQFALARTSQSRTRRTPTTMMPVLPFIRVVDVDAEASTSGEGGVVRRDVLSSAAPHLGQIRAFRARKQR